jgi:cytochrome d ubiquinol oxidase subunit II
VGSLLPSLLFGVALGNVIVGVPLDNTMNYTGSFFTLLRPFPLALGLLGLAAFLLHGSTYAAMKVGGVVQERARNLAKKILPRYEALFMLAFVLTSIYARYALKKPLAWACTIVVVFAFVMLHISLKKGKDTNAFWMSSLTFLGLWGIVGAIHFPNLVKASNDPGLSLTIYNASSSELTLKVMLIIALIGMPIVIGYTIYLYKVFKGKVQIETGS